MTCIESYETGRRTLIPSSWEEATPEQVRALFRIHGDTVRDGGAPLDFAVHALYYLLGIRPTLRDAACEATARNVHDLASRCLGWLLDDSGQPAYRSLANPLPRAGRLQGPADLLADLTFGEFRHAATAFAEFGRTADPEALDECIAILYRTPRGSENRAGRKTGPPEGKHFRRDREAVRREMEPWQKNLVAVWFANCLRHLQTGHVLVNGEDIDLSQLFGGGEGGPASTWNDLAVQLAKQGTIGTMERVEAEPLYSVISVMWANLKEYKRYEATRKARANA